MNKIYCTPLVEELIVGVPQPNLQRRTASFDVINFPPKRLTKQQSSKELNYYIKQRMAPIEHHNMQRSMDMLHTFRAHNQLPETDYVNKQLQKHFLNIDYTDDQKETFGQKLTKIAMKHKEQIKQIERIQREVKKKHEQQAEEVQLEDYQVQIDSKSKGKLNRSKLHYQDALHQMHERKYSNYWSKLSKNLVH